MLVSCQHPRIHQSIIRASVATATFTWVLRVDKITPCLLYIRSARLLVYQPRTSRHPGDTHPSDTEWARPLTIFQSGHNAHLRFLKWAYSPLTIFTTRAYSLALMGGITSKWHWESKVSGSSPRSETTVDDFYTRSISPVTLRSIAVWTRPAGTPTRWPHSPASTARHDSPTTR